jgi:predicted metalloprotease with PDZ domain
MRPVAKKLVPMWALQFVIGAFVVLIAIAVAASLLGPIIKGPTAFFDELGRTISRIAPQPQADLRTDEQLKAVIKAMPEGKLRVGTIVEEQNRVIFTITADRSAVKAAVRPGDELRIARDGNVEIVPTGLPGAIDSLQKAIDDLKRKFFGP